MKIRGAIIFIICSCSSSLTAQVVVEEKIEEVFVLVEEQPSYPGGEVAMNDYFQKNTIYPVVAKEAYIQGKAYIEFTVDKTGSIVDVKVLKSTGFEPLDKEAVRVVKAMPKWYPGKQNGRTINVKYVLPVKFEIR